MMIITVLFIFIELLFKKYVCPNVTVRKYFISKSVILCTLQLLHIRLPKSCGLINVHHKHNVGSVRGFPRSLSPLYLCFPLCLLCVLPYSLHVYLQTGHTALIIAAQMGQFEVVKLLLERGANVNISTNVRYIFVLVSCVYVHVCGGVCMCVCWCNQIVNVHHC